MNVSVPLLNRGALMNVTHWKGTSVTNFCMKFHDILSIRLQATFVWSEAILHS